MHNRILIQIEDNPFLYISKTVIDDNFKATIHSHPNLEILLFTSGNGNIITTNNKIAVSKRKLVIINPNCNHFEVSDNNLEFYSIGLKKTNVYLNDDYFKKIITFDLNEKSYQTINSLYNLIYDESYEKSDGFEDNIKNALAILNSCLSRQEKITFNDSNDESENDLISNIKNILNNNYYLDIRLDDIAHRLSVSKSTVCHEFKKYVGKSIIEYKIEKQLEEANNLLNISDMTVSQIASLVGFNSTSYFIKKYKQKYNKLPSDR